MKNLIMPMTQKDYALLCSVANLALTSALDVLVDVDIHVAYLYSISIFVGTWYAGPVWGVTFALASSLAGTLAGLPTAQEDGRMDLLVTNQLIALAFFLAMVFLVNAWKTGAQRRALHQRTDKLTGLLSAYAFKDFLADEIDKLGRTNWTLAVLYIRCDVADAATTAVKPREMESLLSGVGRSIRLAIRRTDKAARMVNNEFAILLWDIAPQFVLPTAEKILTSITRGSCGLPRQLAFSIGAVSYAQPVESHSEAMDNATQVLASAQSLMATANAEGPNKINFTMFADKKHNAEPSLT